MDPFGEPAADTLAAARLHVQALTDCGLPREALLRALLENYGDGSSTGTGNANTAPVGMEMGGYSQPHQQQPQQQLHLQQQQQQQPHPRLQQQQSLPSPQLQSQVNQPIIPGKMMQHNFGYHSGTRLSISTTSSSQSSASGRASILSTATTMSSVSSQAAGVQDIAPLATPPAPPVKSNNRGTSKPQGAYWCTFCDVAFQRKFDWKRHEDEFHERYKRYPCPNCNRIFWGANTFNQHHKNAHGCTTCPHADRVVRYTQRKTAWACGFCGGFLASRDRYFDHVARHYEDGCNKGHWNHSLVIYGLLHQPSISNAWKELDAALYGHLPRDQQPMLEWDVKVTGNAPGFLEGESPGKLQDLLEFFNESNDDPRFLARLAHDQANIRFRHEVLQPGSLSPTDVVTRPISEPPKLKSSASDKPLLSNKHMSTPQPSGGADGPPPTYDSSSMQHVLKKQRSMALAMDASYSKPHMFSTPPPPPQQQQQQQQLPQPPQLPSQKLINNPFLTAAPESQPPNLLGIQLESTAPRGFYDLTLTHVHPHIQGPNMNNIAQQQQQQQILQQQQLSPQEQQPQFLPQINPVNLYDDWSSMVGTMVDDGTGTTWWQTTQHPSTHQGPPQ
ncbi:hypothetical protein QBC36DRAFT_108971 [Triangularia setosa]|uniref:C2H2-type domain-containing protein n=1 Tax=Triangularia setosa TaxID=2587417 RepID=A0AAN6WA94_9PEZI|nr:hypothetical protein QBC36DRAFT_108971 [Podospora setosa]